ncbi:FliH/SctL family protein [Clostridium chrysemydis]|uniref:FliH/SctL family protein n=1 Tax=Clostridium chrysemydis TaxID=2665504 RepID=UPI0018842B84|nr:FliH/SctL family protein [Clostridium chrysemydis]
MQSSYNLIKASKSLEGNEKTIQTTYIRENGACGIGTDDLDIDPKEIVTQYKEMANNILEEAQKTRERMLVDIMEESKRLEKEAYENGYRQGFDNGIEDAKKEVYENIIPNANLEASNIINNAHEILKNANSEYNNYLEDKKEEIVELAFSIAEQILKRKVEVDNAISDIVDEAIKDAKGENSLLIRANALDIEELKSHVDRWKISKGIRDGIFIIEDNIDRGNVIIEKDSGIIEAGIEVGLEKIKESLRG